MQTAVFHLWFLLDCVALRELSGPASQLNCAIAPSLWQHGRCQWNLNTLLAHLAAPRIPLIHDRLYSLRCEIKERSGIQILVLSCVWCPPISDHNQFKLKHLATCKTSLDCKFSPEYISYSPFVSTISLKFICELKPVLLRLVAEHAVPTYFSVIYVPAPCQCPELSFHISFYALDFPSRQALCPI